jgi:hypothetical protein
MRLLIASLAATLAAALATPAYAQDAGATPATPAATTPTAKPKVGTAAYCNTLKSTTAKNSCLKRVHAQVTTPKAPTTHDAAPVTTTHKTKPKKLTAKPDNAAEAVPAAPTAPSPPQTINVPPLPQKTI